MRKAQKTLKLCTNLSLYHCASKKPKLIEQHSADALIFASLFYYKDFAPLEHKKLKNAEIIKAYIELTLFKPIIIYSEASSVINSLIFSAFQRIAVETRVLPLG